jgi:hypothetical protein
MIMKAKIKLFATGFLQVLLVCLNTYQVAHEKWVGVFFVGFGISFLWSFNVKRIAFGTLQDRILYAFGAAIGSISGLLIAKLYYK